MGEQRRWTEPVQLVKINVVYGGSTFYVCLPGGDDFKLFMPLKVEMVLDAQTLLPVDRGPRWDQIAELGRVAIYEASSEALEELFKNIED